MKFLAHRVILAGGWQRYLIALSSGAVGALAMAPVDCFPAMIVPMTLGVWLLDGSVGRTRWASLRSAALAGWWWGFGYFLAGLWWLGAAFLFEPDSYAWAMPLGVVALPAGLACFTALGFVVARLIWSPGSARILAFAVGLGLSEWLRGRLLTGFPWNDVGMAFGGNLVLGQFASVVGIDGLAIVVAGLAAAPATFADGLRVRHLPPAVLAAALLFALIGGFGFWRLGAGEPGDVAGVKLRIMQPNLVQDAQFRSDNKDAILSEYLALSDRAKSPRASGLADVTHLVWPETALPTLLSHDREILGRIGAALPAGTTLITGAFRLAEPRPGDTAARFFNAIQVIGAGGDVLDSYDKIHLVPFGEYLPLGWLLDRFGLSAFVRIPGRFEAGVVRKALMAPGLPPAWPLICYEAIFPEAAAQTRAQAQAAQRPGLLLNVSNDSWFGVTPGPYQHLAQARLRSIEQGLPLVRAATTGISAVIDPYGRILARLPPGVEDVLDSALPQSIAPTFYAQHGSAATLALWFVLLLGALAFGRARVASWATPVRKRRSRPQIPLRRRQRSS